MASDWPDGDVGRWRGGSPTPKMTGTSRTADFSPDGGEFGRWRNGSSVASLLQEVQRDVKEFTGLQQQFSAQMQSLTAAVQALRPPPLPALPRFPDHCFQEATSGWAPNNSYEVPPGSNPQSGMPLSPHKPPMLLPDAFGHGAGPHIGNETKADMPGIPISPGEYSSEADSRAPSKRTQVSRHQNQNLQSRSSCNSSVNDFSSGYVAAELSKPMLFRSTSAQLGKPHQRMYDPSNDSEAPDLLQRGGPPSSRKHAALADTFKFTPPLPTRRSIQPSHPALVRSRSDLVRSRSDPGDQASEVEIRMSARVSTGMPTRKSTRKSKRHSSENATADYKSRQSTGARLREHLSKQPNSARMKDPTFAFKEKVRQQLLQPAYNVTMFYKTEGIWQYVARAQWFDYLTLGIIALNALWQWIDTDYNHADSFLDAHAVFQLVENLFCVYFSIEWLMRFMAFKHKHNCLRDGWFVFDSLLVLTMVLETWVMTFFILATGISLSGGSDNGVLRLARVLRLSRMARMARLVRAVPELGILIKGMIASMRSVCTTLFLLLIVMYIFAIAFTQLTAGNEIGVDTFQESMFDSVLRSMYTLWLYGVLCLDFAEPLVLDLGPWVGLLYYMFILMAPYTIMNMLIGVLCEVVSAVASSEKEANMVGYAKDKLQAIMYAVDANHNGYISKAEFHKLLECKEACLILKDLDIDVAGLVDFADILFEAEMAAREPDDEDDEAELTFPEFLEMVLQLRGSAHATVKDIVELRKLIRSLLAPQLAAAKLEVPQVYAMRNRLPFFVETPSKITELS